VAPAQVPAATVASLRRSGARSVLLLGGTGAVSADVERQLAATPSYDCAGQPGAPLRVERVSGTNRYDTARRVAQHAGADAVGEVGGHRTAVLASGTGFADALAAGPLSYAGADGSVPTLLTAAGALSPETRSALTALRVQQVVIAGGTAAVGAAVEAELRTLGLQVHRLAGPDRSATAVAIARYAVDALGFAGDQVVLARGDGFADALAGASWAGAQRAPVLLTAGASSLGSATVAHLDASDGRITTVTVLGGESAIGSGSLKQALALLSA
jgi:lactocepin